MSSLRVSMLACLIGVLTGCASSYQVVQLPEREADLYPLSQTQERVTVAIDEITSPERAARYFGADLIRAGILPLAVVVSNYSEHRVTVKPSDVLVHQGTEVIDPLPIESVIAVAKEQRWLLRTRTEEQIEDYFEDLAFVETVVLPNGSYQGVMFFPVPRRPESSDTLFTILNLFREGRPKVRVGLTNLQTRQRLHFGPYPLSALEESRY